MQFCTRFRVSQRLNKDKVLSRKDRVDRLSYEPVELQVARLLESGASLQLAKASAHIVGEFDADSAMRNGDSVIYSVYREDLAVSSARLAGYRDELEQLRMRYSYGGNFAQQNSGVKSADNVAGQVPGSPDLDKKSQVSTPPLGA